MELREDIDAFFRELKDQHGIDDADHEDPDPVASVPPLSESLEIPEPEDAGPPEPAIPEADEITTEDDLFYPGSRHPRRSVTEDDGDHEPEGEDPIWDASPRVYSMRGQQTEFFTISALATALRRESVTMRKWETKGYLPTARYRSPGAGKKQDRLYTRLQIEGLVAIAKEEGLMNPRRKLRIDQTKFPERAQRLFDALERSTQ